MKKALVLTFALLVMLILVGCGGSDSGSSNINVVKDLDIFRYKSEVPTEPVPIYVTSLRTYKTNNPLYQAISDTTTFATKIVEDVPLFVQNISNGNLYFATLTKEGDIYVIQGELYEAFTNDMYPGYKKVYTNITINNKAVSKLTIEVLNSTKSFATTDGKIHTLYLIAYKFEYPNENPVTMPAYWSKDIGWYFAADAFMS